MNNLTKTEKIRLRKHDTCPICGGKITEFDDCSVLKTPYGRFIAYNFFHTKCLIDKYEGRLHEVS